MERLHGKRLVGMCCDATDGCLERVLVTSSVYLRKSGDVRDATCEADPFCSAYSVCTLICTVF